MSPGQRAADLEPTEDDLTHVRENLGATLDCLSCVDPELVFAAQVGGMTAIVTRLREALAVGRDGEVAIAVRTLGAYLQVGEELREQAAAERLARIRTWVSA